MPGYDMNWYPLMVVIAIPGGMVVWYLLGELFKKKDKK